MIYIHRLKQSVPEFLLCLLVFAFDGASYASAVSSDSPLENAGPSMHLNTVHSVSSSVPVPTLSDGKDVNIRLLPRVPHSRPLNSVSLLLVSFFLLAVVFAVYQCYFLIRHREVNRRVNALKRELSEKDAHQCGDGGVEGDADIAEEDEGEDDEHFPAPHKSELGLIPSQDRRGIWYAYFPDLMGAGECVFRIQGSFTRTNRFLRLTFNSGIRLSVLENGPQLALMISLWLQEENMNIKSVIKSGARRKRFAIQLSQMARLLIKLLGEHHKVPMTETQRQNVTPALFAAKTLYNEAIKTKHGNDSSVNLNDRTLAAAAVSAMNVSEVSRFIRDSRLYPRELQDVVNLSATFMQYHYALRHQQLQLQFQQAGMVFPFSETGMRIPDCVPSRPRLMDCSLTDQVSAMIDDQMKIFNIYVESIKQVTSSMPVPIHFEPTPLSAASPQKATSQEGEQVLKLSKERGETADSTQMHAGLEMLQPPSRSPGVVSTPSHQHHVPSHQQIPHQKGQLPVQLSHRPDYSGPQRQHWTPPYRPRGHFLPPPVLPPYPRHPHLRHAFSAPSISSITHMKQPVLPVPLASPHHPPLQMRPHHLSPGFQMPYRVPLHIPLAVNSRGGLPGRGQMRGPAQSVSQWGFTGTAAVPPGTPLPGQLPQDHGIHGLMQQLNIEDSSDEAAKDEEQDDSTKV